VLPDGLKDVAVVMSAGVSLVASMLKIKALWEGKRKHAEEETARKKQSDKGWTDPAV
jgi:hypothetical protein